jgi:hypothetical protein
LLYLDWLNYLAYTCGWKKPEISNFYLNWNNNKISLVSLEITQRIHKSNLTNLLLPILMPLEIFDQVRFLKQLEFILLSYNDLY